MNENPNKLSRRSMVGALMGTAAFNFAPHPKTDSYPVERNQLDTQTISSLAALRQTRPSNDLIYVEGHTTPFDGGGGIFQFDRDSSASDDNGLVIQPSNGRQNGRWHRVIQDNNTIVASWFGLRGDGVTDDREAIQAALDACPENGVVILPQPKIQYITTSSLRIEKSVELVGNGILATIRQDGTTEPVIVVDTPHGSIVIIDNFRLIGGSKGIDFIGESLTRHSRIRNLDIHGCVDVGIDIDSGMIGARFENVQVRASPNIGIRCLNTTHIIGVQFVSCRIGTTDVAAIHFEHNHASSVHPISFFNLIVEGNRGAGIVFRGGYLISLQDVHFERNGLFTGEPDLIMSSNEHLRAICEVHFERGTFSALSDLQIANGRERIRFETHHVGLIMNGTLINVPDVINASNESAGVWMAFTNTQTIPTVINYPGQNIMWTRFGHLYLGSGLTTSGISSNLKDPTPFPYNLSGSFTIEGENQMTDIKFDFNEPNTDYKISITPTARVGAPQAGSNRLVWIEKQLTGFKVHLEAAPGVGNSSSFDWMLIR